MQSIEEKKSYELVVSRTCFVTDIIYLLGHVFYFVIFLVIKAYVPFYLNIVSILFYIVFYFIIKRRKYYIYAICCGNEFWIFTIVSTLMCGFHSGFYLLIIGLCVVSFFTVYFSREGKKDSKGSIIWTCMSILITIFLYIFTSFNEPYYLLPKWAEMTLFIFHTFAVFSFVLAYLLIFVLYAMKLEKKIINESRTDELTQIHNRYDLYNFLDSIDIKDDYSLAIFDIDDFKKINDIYGHVCGDYILKEVAKLAMDNLKDSFVSRYGGEEFIIVSKIYGDINKMYQKLDEFRKVIKNNIFKFNENEIHITITIGVKQYENNIGIDEWINLADNKLYVGKNNGKDKTVL